MIKPPLPIRIYIFANLPLNYGIFDLPTFNSTYSIK